MFLGRKLSGAVYATLIHEAVNVSAGERTLILGMAIVNQPTCEREVAKSKNNLEFGFWSDSDLMGNTRLLSRLLEYIRTRMERGSSILFRTDLSRARVPVINVTRYV